jgi:hypothetical protein
MEVEADAVDAIGLRPLFFFLDELLRQGMHVAKSLLLGSAEASLRK